MQSKNKSRARGNESFWRETIRCWKESGKSQAAFCRERAIALSTFGYWRRRLKRNESVKPRFYPLVVSTNCGPEITAHDKCGLRVLLGRFAIDIGDQFSPAVLQRLVTTLEQLR